MLPTPDTSHVPYNRVYEPAEDSFLMIDTLALPAETAFLQQRFAPPTGSSRPSPTPAPSPPFVVEIGSGSGVVLAFVAAQASHLFGPEAARNGPLTLAVDVNPFACAATVETVRRAAAEAATAVSDGSSVPLPPPLPPTTAFMGAVRANLTSALRPGQVDVLLFNPPYVPTPTMPTADDEHESEIQAADGQRQSARNSREDEFARDSHLLELAYAGGRDGMETTDRLLNALPEVLSARGCAYVLLCAQNRPEAVKARIRSWPAPVPLLDAGCSWRAETVGSSGKQAGWEKLQIVRIWQE